MSIVVMGVCGSGKSTVGLLLAKRLGWPFIEGDELHPRTNVEKMRRGEALCDDDRWPWLERIAGSIAEHQNRGKSVVVTCSALKRAYRDRLRTAGTPLYFVHLRGEPGLLAERMAERREHFMPPGLLDSQLATLEVPENCENVLEIDVKLPPHGIVDHICSAMPDIRPASSREET